MKPKQSSPHDELKGIDFIPTMKSKRKEVSLSIISLEGNDVKEALQSAMTILFKSLAEVHKLQREAREGRSGG